MRDKPALLGDLAAFRQHDNKELASLPQLLPLFLFGPLLEVPLVFFKKL